MMTLEIAEEVQNLTEAYEKAGQGHVLKHLNKPYDEKSVGFVNQLKGIDPQRVNDLYESALKHESSLKMFKNSKLQPPSGVLALSKVSDFDKNGYYLTGLEAIRDGKVAALVLAGGQGTRLGYNGPKGAFSLGMPSNKSLFQYFSEKILRLQVIAEKHFHLKSGAVAIPFFVMTSPLNDQSTKEFFRKNDFFGLCSANVHFFSQGVLPCLKPPEGKFMLSSPYQICCSPDGNGGLYKALKTSGSLSKMKDIGVSYLHVFSVDNCLAIPADPMYIGACIGENSECGCQCVWKKDSKEKVGIAAIKNNKPCIVEYTELPESFRELRESSGTSPVGVEGRLVYGAGNICNHFYTIDFIKNKAVPALEVGTEVPYHIARKKILCIEDEDEINNKHWPPQLTPHDGIKLESFIFDVFPLADKMTILEVERSEAFSPVKNASGPSTKDSPETAKRDLSNLAMKWAADAGAVIDDLNHMESSFCEICPLVSIFGEGLEGLKGKILKVPFSIEKGNDEELVII